MSLDVVQLYPARRASFCVLLDRGGEKEALNESRRAFQVAAARIFGLVNLVFSRQTGIVECRLPFVCLFCILTNFYFLMYYMFLHTDLRTRRKIRKKEKKTKHIYIADSHTITY